jgi:Cdc6-like AAA superfamily ATPase
MMIIDSGFYTLTDRNLVLEILDGFDLSGQPCRFILTGANGSGKTSFLEKILIPVLQRNNVDFLYIGQDIRTQLYTLRALLATMGLTVIGADERQLLRVWVSHSPAASILIMDEFDKYFSDIDFIFRWTRNVIQFCFVVTHRDQPMQFPDSSSAVRVIRVRFEPVGQDGGLKKVQLRQERS